MRCTKPLRRRATRFFFSRLMRDVKGGRIRPFHIDEEGLWFETRYGFSVYSNLNDRILELEVNSVWEQMESTFVSNNVTEGTVFLDVGANIGYFSMLAAQQKAGKVLAIEPAPRTYEMLRRNVEHNMLGDIIEPLGVALGCKEHKTKFVCSLGPKNHIEYHIENVHRDLPTIEVDVTTLDNLLQKRKQIDKVDIIKVDIEGAEYAFLQGAVKTLKTFKPIVMMEIEEHRLVKFDATADSIFNFMNDLGYKYLSVGEDSITKASTCSEDLKRGRDFVFYTGKHDLVY